MATAMHEATGMRGARVTPSYLVHSVQSVVVRVVVFLSPQRTP